jgi:hopanoid biosynthesis associated radical SAM protein HpnH
MPVPLNQMVKVGAYVVRQHLAGRKRYPLVLMLEPLFRCNLACSGCGKIDYPDEILNQRLSVEDSLKAADECGAPVVAIAGGEPLLHKEMPQIVEGLLARGKFIYLCTNALLLEKQLDRFKPHRNFAWDVAVDQPGVYDRAVSAIRAAKARGFRVCINTTLFDGADPQRVADFMDETVKLGLDGVMISPGYAYERAPDQQHFLNRQKSKQLFRDIFSRGKGRGWKFNQYLCTPWGKPTRNVFGWQRPCYLLGEGYTRTFAELMETTDWDKYGTGNYEKCADCMVHSGYEATAVVDAVRNPLKVLSVALRGPRTSGAMAKEISLDHQRPADFVFRRHVDHAMTRLKAGKPMVPEAAETADAAD